MSMFILFQMSPGSGPAAPDWVHLWRVAGPAWPVLGGAGRGHLLPELAVSARPLQSCDNRPQHGLPWSLLRPL